MCPCGTPWSMNFFKTCTFSLFFILTKVQGSSFPFDLSAIEDEILVQPKYIFSTVPAREIGTGVKLGDEVTKDRVTAPVDGPRVHDTYSSVSAPTITIGVKRKASNHEIRNPIRSKNFIMPISAINPELSHLQIIENEVNFENEYFYTRQKRESLFKMMSLISANDYNGLKEYEPKFKAVFEISKLTAFEKNGMKNYLLIPAILFGAWDIQKYVKFSNINSKAIHQIIDILLKYLILTKPFDVVFKTIMKLYPEDMNPEMRSDLISLIKNRNPNMEYYENFCLNFIGRCYNSANNIISILKKDKKEILKINIIHSTISNVIFRYRNDQELIKSYLRIPLEKTNVFLASSDEKRFDFLKLSIINDDVDVFVSILEVDPGIINYNCKSILHHQFDNIITAIINSKSINCFKFILDTFPEILNSYELSPVRIALESQFSCKFIPILEERGLINPEMVLNVFGGGGGDNKKQISLLEAIVFNQNSIYAHVLLPKVNYNILERIFSNPRSLARSIHQTEFLHKLLKFFGIDVFIDAVKILKIDLDKQTFRLANYEGNGAIFFYGKSTYIEDCQKLNISTIGPYYLHFDHFGIKQKRELDINQFSHYQIFHYNCVLSLLNDL